MLSLVLCPTAKLGAAAALEGQVAAAEQAVLQLQKQGAINGCCPVPPQAALPAQLAAGSPACVDKQRRGRNMQLSWSEVQM